MKNTNKGLNVIINGSETFKGLFGSFFCGTSAISVHPSQVRIWISQVKKARDFRVGADENTKSKNNYNVESGQKRLSPNDISLYLIFIKQLHVNLNPNGDIDVDAVNIPVSLHFIVRMHRIFLLDLSD